MKEYSIWSDFLKERQALLLAVFFLSAASGIFCGFIPDFSYMMRRRN